MCALGSTLGLYPQRRSPVDANAAQSGGGNLSRENEGFFVVYAAWSGALTHCVEPGRAAENANASYDQNGA